MLTDEELKAIESRKARYLEHWQPFDEAPSDDWKEAFEDVDSLLSEVKRLRAENQSYGRTIVALSSGWQSVADGAKPGPEDWYVVAIVSRERNFDGRPDGEIRQGCTVIGNEIIELYGRARHPGTEFPREGTHFLVIPAPPFHPPPIRRETKEPCRCCNQPATLSFGTYLACCDYCAEHCRAPGPIDTNWYHDVIDPDEACELERTAGIEPASQAWKA